MNVLFVFACTFHMFLRWTGKYWWKKKKKNTEETQFLQRPPHPASSSYENEAQPDWWHKHFLCWWSFGCQLQTTIIRFSASQHLNWQHRLLSQPHTNQLPHLKRQRCQNGKTTKLMKKNAEKFFCLILGQMLFWIKEG